MPSDSIKTIGWLVRRFLPYLKAVRWQIGFAGLLMLLSPLISIFLLWLMKFLIDDVFVAKNIDVLPAIAVGYVILVGIKLLIDYSLTRSRSGNYRTNRSECSG